ncbi:hypothetical protein PR202_ga06988 [Eleusine coracana subsp. coracana]|uniref:Gnk2-homologous domain-containing protein n=1 Tax=Eleusine coracana subsp. coracana TaxID=191504 RepID=A0AAV5BY32_ELECO|nr:hypothetical protein PR202_ga06988 [Eleusine coracana subsp. coracana]
MVALAVAGLLVALTPLASGIPWAAPCDGNTTGNYTSNSVYATNLRAVAAALPTNVSATPALFATAAAGASPNKVYALGQCRGDQDATACRDCIAAAFGNAPRLCPEKKAAAVFYDVCQIGFSDRDFLASTTNSADQEVQFINAQNVSADIVGRFNATAYELFHAMADYVAGASSTTTSSPKRFVTAAVGFDDATYPKIYGVASCTPDLTSGQCRGCLAEAIDEYSQEFPHNAKGARITGMRCALRYEVYPFYNGTSMLQLPGTQAGVCFFTTHRVFFSFGLSVEKNNSKGELNIFAGKKSETGKILAIVLPTVIAVVAIIAMLLCFWRRTKSKRSLSSASHMEEIGSIESLLIDLSTLRLATENFSEKNKLGEGGFGEVYKSDIYSFGVLILEILTGMRNSDTYNSDQPVDLPSLIWEHWTMKAVMEMIDPFLRNDYSSQEDIFRCVHIGLSCVQEDPVDRPNISVISVMLDSSTIPSQNPAKPAFYVEMSGNFGSGLYPESCPRVEPTTESMVMSLNELSITDPEPR